MPTIKRNNNSNANITRAHHEGVIQNLVKRITGNYIVRLSNIIRRKGGGRYALVGNTGEFLGFATVSNAGAVRSIDLIATRKGYGNMLISRIINNAKSNGKTNILLTPKTNKSLSESNQKKLINWYAKHGFVNLPCSSNMVLKLQ